MNPLTLEWVLKAEGDFSTGKRELLVRKSPNYDAACFHAQQTAEKYLKAYLQEHAKSIPYTHVLADLLSLCTMIDPYLKSLKPDLDVLEGYAVQFRYPGHTADRQEALDAIKAARKVRLILRALLGF
jgi:HEPN domain-containing protein